MNNDMTERAFRAYFRAGGIDQPANSSGLRSHKGRDYVLLQNGNGPLAVYRVTRGGRLKGLKRWPAGVVR